MRQRFSFGMFLGDSMRQVDTVVLRNIMVALEQARALRFANILLPEFLKKETEDICRYC